MQSTLEVVTELVARIVRRAPSELPPGRPLLDEGLLDSLQVVELADALEQRFPLLLDPFDLSPEHFCDLRHLARLVDRKLAAGQMRLGGDASADLAGLGGTEAGARRAI